jgi:hypothetical protein
MIHLLGTEAQGQNLLAYKFVCCEYENKNDGKKIRIFSRIDSSSSSEEFGKLIERTGATPRGVVRHSAIEYLD